VWVQDLLKLVLGSLWLPRVQMHTVVDRESHIRGSNKLLANPPFGHSPCGYFVNLLPANPFFSMAFCFWFSLVHALGAAPILIMPLEYCSALPTLHESLQSCVCCPKATLHCSHESLQWPTTFISPCGSLLSLVAWNLGKWQPWHPKRKRCILMGIVC